MHDGSTLLLKKMEADYDPTSKVGALRALQEASARGEFATGLIYVEPAKADFLTLLNLVEEPLATLPAAAVRPSREAFEQIMEGLR